MKRFFNLIFSVFGVCYFSWAQTTPKDSLLRLFKDTKAPDSVRFDSGTRYMGQLLGKDLDSARGTGIQLLDFAQNVDNKKWEATSYRLIGNTYAIQGNFEKAQEFFFNSHEILLELNDKEGLAVTFNNIGTVFYELGNYVQAQVNLLESLRLAEELQDDVAASRALNNLGNIHSDLENNEKALGYYGRSLELKEKLGHRNRLPAGYNNIGLIYIQMKKHDLAIENLTKSATIAKEIGDLQSMTRAQSNLGIEYSNNGELDKALDYFNESIGIKQDINDLDGLASAYVYRGQNYLAMKRFDLARSDCLESLELSNASGALNTQSLACDCLGNALEGLGNHREALQYFRRFESLKDSLFDKEKTQEMTRIEMNYQFEKKQLADSIAFHKLQTEQKVAFERDLNKEQNKFFITLMISLAALLFMLFLYWKYTQNLKVKNLENKLLNSEIEYKKKDLTNFAVNISNNQEWAESLAQRLEILKASTGRKRLKELENLETDIKNKIWVNKSSDEFYKKIDALSSSFYDRLTKEFKDLTKTDIRLCSLIKLNLNTKQIAALQNINPSSVKMSRNRLRKKLNLSPEDDLNAFLRTF
ncbi:tetratricopeptide repeat protein [Flagellimonas allohymeniacidonis]|nr:transcriptional regulator [Allomuricauda hymeniacidonis]